MFIDLAHEFLRFLSFVGDFLDFEIKEGPLGIFDYFLKCYPVFKISRCFIIPQRLITFLSPPALGMSCDID